MPVLRDDLVVLGRVTSVYGIKGWVKIFSETEPMQAILEYHPWFIKPPSQDWQPITLAGGKPHGKGLVVRFAGCEDRDMAAAYRGAVIAVPKANLPDLDEGDYYWHQLEGLRVYSGKLDGEPLLLGRVSHLMETGANDVMVVKACEGSIDTRERLLPYLPGQVVTRVDLQLGEIRVDWDPEF